MEEENNIFLFFKKVNRKQFLQELETVEERECLS